MADFDICNGCSSGRQGFSSYTYSFSKKLIVATCLAIVMAMCLTPTEAASLEHKNQRQRLEDMTTLTKEMSEMPSEIHMRHKRRHQRDQMKVTKDSFGNKRPNQDEALSIMNDKIIRKLKNTLRDFTQKKYIVNDSAEYRDANIKLPTTNFMDVRFHKFKGNKSESSLLRRKFAYNMPKLYKSLKKYYEIFKILVDFEIPSSETDILFDNYQTKRRVFFRETIRNLHSTIVVILDGLNASRIEVPTVNKSQIHLEYFKKPKRSDECLVYDGTVIRGYGITLNRWYCLLSSKETRNKKEQQRCMKREKKLKNRRQHRRQKTRKRTVL